MEIVLQAASLEVVRVGAPRRSGRAVVLGAAVAIGSCAFAGCGEAGDHEPPVPLAAAAVVEEEAIVVEPEPKEEEEPAELAFDAEEARVRRFEASPGFTPDPLLHRASTAGGPIDANVEDERCRGWLASKPDFLFDARRPFAELGVMVASEVDTTLVVVGPNGQLRCADDDDGAHPVVRELFEPGLHRIWVGTKEPGVKAEYVLALSELDEWRPSRLPN